MIDSTIFKAVQGVAKLSGSFAFSGLVAQYGNGKTHQAFAFTDPVYYQLRDVPYPVRRPSGKIVQDLRSKRPDVAYPVRDLLKSPWETFLPESVAWACFKSFCIYSAVYMQGSIQRYNEAEHQAREEALLRGESEDDIEVEMPEIDWDDVQRILKSSARGGIRDVSTTFIRRILEWKVADKLDPRISWKLVKDFTPSARRKLQRHSRFRAMALTARTTMRSSILMQVADYIFSTTMDAYRLLVVPFLPERWQRRLGVRQYGFPSAPPKDPEREDLPPEGNADADADIAGPPADLEVLEEGSPADWSWRFRLLCKKATGNAARCWVSLGAGAVGAGLTSGVLPLNAVALACNGFDIMVAIFVTNPDLNDWYEDKHLPWTTFALALASAGCTAVFLLQASSERSKSA